MHKNIELENRIKDRNNYDKLHNINSYGGMAMDCATVNERNLRLEELEYIRTHPVIFRHKLPSK